MTSPFGPSEERHLMSCLGRVVSHVGDGMSPDNAIAKVASDEKLPPESLPLMVNAYNVGQQTLHREKCAGQGTSCLMEEHPIARIENVQSELYPKQADILTNVKAAMMSGVSDAYSMPPTNTVKAACVVMVKAAETPQPVEKAATKISNEFTPLHHCRVRDVARQKLAGLESLLRQSRDGMVDSLDRLRGYMRRLPGEKVAELEFNARTMFGRGVTELFNHVTRGLKVARAADEIIHSSTPTANDSDTYDMIATTLRKVAEHVEDAVVIENAKQKIAFEVAKLDPFAKPVVTPSPSVLASPAEFSAAHKQAGVLGTALGTAFGSMTAQMRQGISRPTSELVSGVEDDLSDPEHMASLRTMEARAMLGDLMSNDEVISSYDPAEVTAAYNELVQLSPNLGSHSSVVRPLLRKRLTGGVIEPFDAEQIRKIDSSMRSPSGMPINQVPTAA